MWQCLLMNPVVNHFLWWVGSVLPLYLGVLILYFDRFGSGTRLIILLGWERGENCFCICYFLKISVWNYLFHFFWHLGFVLQLQGTVCYTNWELLDIPINLRGKCTPAIKWACFAPNLRILNMFLQNIVYNLKQIVPLLSR